MPNEAVFQRGLDSDAIEHLKELSREQGLYQDRLLPDIERGEVFPAIRSNGVICFYHRGGRLFTYESGVFKTHVKYASVLLGTRGDYVGEADLQADTVKHLTTFEDEEGYRRLKENCYLYSGDEAEGVSFLYGASSYASCADNVVVLDIEVVFSRPDPDDHGGPDKAQRTRRKKVDRVDFVLYNKRENVLRFYEAKCFSNSELWSSQGQPKVAGQLGRYNEQIRKRHDEILHGYQEYVQSVKRLFRTPAVKTLTLPQHIDSQGVVLFVFGYDSSQEKKLRDDLGRYQAMRSLRLRSVGDPKLAMADKIWKRVVQL